MGLVAENSVSPAFQRIFPVMLGYTVYPHVHFQTQSDHDHCLGKKYRDTLQSKLTYNNIQKIT
jgi:hypothetical protein